MRGSAFLTDVRARAALASVAKAAACLDEVDCANVAQQLAGGSEREIFALLMEIIAAPGKRPGAGLPALAGTRDGFAFANEGCHAIGAALLALATWPRHLAIGDARLALPYAAVVEEQPSLLEAAISSGLSAAAPGTPAWLARQPPYAYPPSQWHRLRHYVPARQLASLAALAGRDVAGAPRPLIPDVAEAPLDGPVLGEVAGRGDVLDAFAGELEATPLPGELD